MKILFIHNYLASFTKLDLDILHSKYTVRELYARNNIRSLLHIFPNFVSGVLWSDIVFSWFAGFHAFLPFILGKLLRKRCVVVASGYDVANLTEFGYGSMRPGLRKLIGNLIFTLADQILPVSNFTAQELAANVKVDTGKIRTIYHGFRPTPDIDYVNKINRVVMVGTISRVEAKIKGIEVFIRTATLIPDTEFILIGPILDNDILAYLQSFASPNVTFIGYVKDVYQSEIIRNAKVYAQLSYYESFGCALAEAMMQGCIPVVTKCGALPEVAGDTGFYTEYGNVEKTAKAIKSALAMNEGYGEHARERITQLFSIEERATKLFTALDIIYSDDRR